MGLHIDRCIIVSLIVSLIVSDHTVRCNRMCRAESVDTRGGCLKVIVIIIIATWPQI